MTPRLSYLNLFGVLVLAVLCVFQWQHDRHLNLTLEQSEGTRLNQVSRLTDQTNEIKELNEELGQFKASLMDEHRQRMLTEAKLHTANSTNVFLTMQAAQLKAAITNWVNAVAVRDAHIQEANHRIEQLSANLNASVRKFNALATNYNAVVQELSPSHADSGTNTLGQQP